MNEEITLREVADYLDHVGIQFMATIGLDGKPKVRPMQYMVLEDEKLWFCTNSKKEVYAELQANPTIELCGCKLEKDEIQEPEVPQRAEAGLTGWIDCFPKSRLAGTLFCGGVADPRAISGHSKLNEAYEMGLHC